MDDFRAQCRRQLKRSLDSRIKYGFFRNYKPIEDDEPVRIFERMSDYRKRADENVSRYLGYKLTKPTENAE